VASYLGKSVAFRVYLPALSNVQPVGPASLAPPAPSGKETILVVDDEQAVRKMVVLGLQLYGYHVLEASDGTEAIRVWDAADGIDLLFTDMRMPGKINGIELFEMLKAKDASLIGIISSGYSEETLRPRELVPPDLTFLPKPYDVKTLVGTVRNCLDIKRVRFGS